MKVKFHSSVKPQNHLSEFNTGSAAGKDRVKTISTIAYISLEA